MSGIPDNSNAGYVPAPAQENLGIKPLQGVALGETKFGMTPEEDAEYKAFVQSAYDGRLLVGVDRIFARKLYTEISTSEIEEATGEKPRLAKLVVWFAYLASPLAMLITAILAAFSFRWWALVIIPAGFLGWMLNSMTARRGSSSMWFLTLVGIAAVGIHLMRLLADPYLSGFIASFAFALWCDRLLYSASTFFFRAFILRNPRAFLAFGEGVRIREAS